MQSPHGLVTALKPYCGIRNTPHPETGSTPAPMLLNVSAYII
ncbi:hypothetical protein [Brochothrix phage ADU4]|nr:hypothetical protein [Brochothrix phage ADU4]